MNLAHPRQAAEFCNTIGIKLRCHKGADSFAVEWRAAMPLISSNRRPWTRRRHRELGSGALNLKTLASSVNAQPSSAFWVSGVGESRHPHIAADDGCELFSCDHVLQADETVRDAFRHYIQHPFRPALAVAAHDLHDLQISDVTVQVHL